MVSPRDFDELVDATEDVTLVEYDDRAKTELIRIVSRRSAIVATQIVRTRTRRPPLDDWEAAVTHADAFGASWAELLDHYERPQPRELAGRSILEEVNAKSTDAGPGGGEASHHDLIDDLLGSDPDAP